MAGAIERRQQIGQQQQRQHDQEEIAGDAQIRLPVAAQRGGHAAISSRNVTGSPANAEISSAV